MAKARDLYSYEAERFTVLRDAGRGVTGAFGNTNKWLDTVQEHVRITFGMPHTSDAIHAIAHAALVWLDEFSAILHERNLMTEYPATMEFAEDLPDMETVFEVVIGILEELDGALDRFRMAADRPSLRPLALKTEEIMMDVSGEYTKVLEMWSMWDTGVSASSFDGWVLHLGEGGV